MLVLQVDELHQRATVVQALITSSVSLCMQITMHTYDTTETVTTCFLFELLVQQIAGNHHPYCPLCTMLFGYYQAALTQ